METPFDLLPYLSLVSALFVAMKCYMTQYRKNRLFLHQLEFYDVEVHSRQQDNQWIRLPLYRLFIWRQRKIPVRERSPVSDEDGRSLLAFR
ncbi:hypothetical protein PNH38_09060 [Anoxybacillus rupiensis]|jgi:hypothetical protein|uniref:Uncharacterized protein n=1 Tax=Anoxybacteroides rupiense TaxID=311460 RepID=A0ABD5IVZ4_9BACL|nr:MULTISPECIES: hypothetical protein [Anoxybacillus]KXG09210.1 hypothetical protein AT864_02440 [Anoxybacillus sp. P3H1B]MBB3905824.1 hypothetical protein [Anoxybacillus rupiensis]MBS2772410.1 hypothetical protein [Anoxybacillus rupiensis]MDE8564036.1 hypothetical protein [Anoxybacillus rupiensis]MED5051571.1 hypothetical protein [Anoxybacillus rupiensis]